MKSREKKGEEEKGGWRGGEGGWRREERGRREEEREGGSQKISVRVCVWVTYHF